MSGHSKWHNIQGRKNAQDAKRGKVFQKLSGFRRCVLYTERRKDSLPPPWHGNRTGDKGSDRISCQRYCFCTEDYSRRQSGDCILL